MKKSSLEMFFIPTCVALVLAVATLICCEPSKQLTNTYHQLHPLYRADPEIKSKPQIGVITEGPVKLDGNFSMVRVQVSTRPDADYSSEFGALISQQEKPKVGDRVVITTYTVYNNPLSSYTFVRIGTKEKETAQSPKDKGDSMEILWNPANAPIPVYTHHFPTINPPEFSVHAITPDFPPEYHPVNPAEKK